MFLATILLLLPRSAPLPDTAVVTVDLIELNTCYNIEEGKQEDAYTQFIFYEYQVEYNRFSVRAWTMCEPGKAERPHRKGAYWVMRLHDRGRWLTVRSKRYIQTRTLVEDDPERLDKRYMPDKKRRGLWPK